VAARRDRDLQLGADAVRGCDQHGILEAGGLGIEEAAEAAEKRIGAGTRGGAGQGLDRFDEAVAGIDVDAGITVRQPWFRGVARYGFLAAETV
jgi:hypothetical protein